MHRTMVLDEYFDEHESSSITSYHNIDLFDANGKLRCNQSLTLDKHVGAGSFSDVYLARLNGKPVALKILKQIPGPRQQQAFERELAALRRTRDNNRTLDLYAYRPAPYYWIIVQYMNQGSLSSLLKKHKGILPTDQILDVAHQLVLALLSLHQMQPPLFHRDVTAENVLFNDGQLRLGDFGVAVDFVDTGASPSALMADDDDQVLFLSPNGNPRYRAPEVVGGSPYSLRAEVYNFGSVLFEMLTGKPPFSEVPIKEIAAFRQNGCTPFVDPDVAELRHPDLWRLVEACWAKNPVDRPSFEQILDFIVALQQASLFVV